jgi:hypothetical protein
MFVSVLDGKCITFFVAKANPVGFQSKYLGHSEVALQKPVFANKKPQNNTQKC